MLETVIASSALIGFVFLVRSLLLGKVDPRLQYALWLLVAIRLVAPISWPGSPVSVLNLVDLGTEAGSSRNLSQETPGWNLGPPQGPTISSPGVNTDTLPPNIVSDPTVPPHTAFEPAEVSHSILHTIWAAGAILVGLWFLAQNIWFYARLRKSRQRVFVENCRPPVYTSVYVKSPCLFGLQPAIYVHPDHLQDIEAMKYIVAHEETHCKHGDHLWSYLRCFCLAVHWFNPFVWWAAVVSRKDCEIACDFSALRVVGDEHRKAYGNALVHLIQCGTGPFHLLSGATTMTGGKSTIRERITMIAKTPKMALSTMFAVLCLVVVAAGCTFTRANAPRGEDGFKLVTLPLNQESVFPPIPFPFQEDRSFPGSEPGAKDYLTLSEAIYTINYSRSHCPGYEEGHGVLARISAFTEASAATTTVFGNGKPVEAWLSDRSLIPFVEGDERPAWDVIGVDLDSEVQIGYHFLVDAQTGDLYVDAGRCGGYYPSPYLKRSEYGRAASTLLEAGGLGQDTAAKYLAKLNNDLWSSQYHMVYLDLPGYVKDTPVNRFVLAWGNNRMERSKSDPSLKLISEPVLQKIAVTSMEALDSGSVKVKYQSYVEYDLQDSAYLGVSSDQTVLFEQSGDGWVLADIGRFPWGLDDYYKAYDREEYLETSGGNLFDPQKVKVGDAVAGLTITDIPDIREYGWQQSGPGDFVSAIVQFQGKVTLTGRYYCGPAENLESSSGLPRPGFFVDEESSGRLPRIDGDTRSPHFAITNVGDALELLGPPGYEATATIIVDDYLIRHTPSSEGINQARLVAVIDRQELAAQPLFSKSSGDIYDYMPDLLAGNPVSAYHLLPCFENFTRSTWSDLNRVYGGPSKEPGWFSVLWTALRDSALCDDMSNSEDQILRDYYIGKAFLTSDGAYSEGLADILSLQWRQAPNLYNDCLNRRFSEEDSATLRFYITSSLNYWDDDVFGMSAPTGSRLLLAPYPVNFPFGHDFVETGRESFRAESYGTVTVVDCEGLEVAYLHPNPGVYTVISLRTDQTGYSAGGVAVGDTEDTLLGHWEGGLRSLDSIHLDDEAWFGTGYERAYAYTEGTKSLIYLVKNGKVSGIGLLDGLDGPAYPLN